MSMECLTLTLTLTLTGGILARHVEDTLKIVYDNEQTDYKTMIMGSEATSCMFAACIHSESDI